MSTDPESAAGVEVIPAVTQPNPAEVAHQLTALAMLSAAVTEKDKALRKHVRRWAVGTKITLTLPNPDQPEAPYKVGEVRCDGPVITPSIADPEAFTAWALENAREHVVVEPARCATPEVPPVKLAQLLAGVFEAAQRRCVGAFSEPAAGVMWELLRTSGWTLAPVENVPERSVVEPGYVRAVLDMSKAQLGPCAPGGLIPDGVKVSIGQPKPYVQPTQDRALIEGFLSARADLPLPEAVDLALDGLT